MRPTLVFPRERRRLSSFAHGQPIVARLYRVRARDARRRVMRGEHRNNSTKL
jgi:hypothetical protein